MSFLLLLLDDSSLPGLVVSDRTPPEFTVRRRARLALSLPSLVMASGALAWAMVQRYEVVGDSMCPTLTHGDRLLVLKWRWVPVGRILVLQDSHSDDPFIKRLVRRSHSSIWVEGDNSLGSTDSRQLGWFSNKSVVGWAIYRYYPSSRAGSLIGE